MNIAFLCRHLTGAGHLVRRPALALAGATLRLGHLAILISGGRPSEPGPTVRPVQR